MSVNMPNRSRVQYEPIPAKSILNPVKAPSMPFDWSINPYRGCQHGCSFCYARSTHSFLGEEADDTFQTRIFMKSDAPQVLRSQLEKRLRGNRSLQGWRPVAIGTATDPYQQIESKAMLTRGCLEVLAELQVPVTITTRSPLILRDLDLLRKLPDSSVNISISTLDPKIWRQFEPSSPSPAQRMKTLERLRAEVISAGVFMAPILPYITDEPAAVEELISAAANAGSQFMMPSILRLSTQAVKVWFFQTLQQHYPQHLAAYAQLYEASSSAPADFRYPLMRRIDDLLQTYGLNKPAMPVAGKAPLAPGRPEAETGPVQLTLF